MKKKRSFYVSMLVGLLMMICNIAQAQEFKQLAEDSYQLNVTRMSGTDILNLITQNSDYRVAYAQEQGSKMSKPISVKATGNMNAILQAVLPKYGILFSLEGKQILLKFPESSNTTSENATPTATANNAEKNTPENEQSASVAGGGMTVQNVSTQLSPVVNRDSTTAKQLDEVVVVGYGTQKKKLVTGAISSVTAKDIENIPHDGRPEAALQGRATGVTIATNSGQPGSSYTIRIRGVTSFGAGNDPLWVVDGIVVSTANLNFLNQSDIQSIEVLKDAASAAIYGTRAATGVILVTTKKGIENANGKFTVNYNGFIGLSTPSKLIPMLNATQYATIMNERALGDGNTMTFANPQSLGEGTNWQKEIFNNALRTNHEVSLGGGGQSQDGRNKYHIYASFGYQNQQGIVLKKVSQYERYTARIAHDETFFKVFKFGQDIAYSRNNSKGVSGLNTEFGGPMMDVLNLDPLTPVIANATQALGSQYSNPYMVKASNGMPYGISAYVGQDVVNPVAQVQNMLGNNGYSDNIIGNSYLEIHPLEGLVIRSQIGINRNYWGNQSYTPLYYLSSYQKNILVNSLYRGSGKALVWNWDNTISYTKEIKGHTFSILGGYSMYEDGIGNFTDMTYRNLPVSNYKDANFNYPSNQVDQLGSTYDYTLHKIVSFFGRVNYNYEEKYLLTGILRADGSSRFGANNRFGIFPSVSGGWVPSKEKFWIDNIDQKYISFLKVRLGYGVTGNDNFSNFQYLSTIGGGNNYTIGSATIPVLGNSPNTLENPDLKWERTGQWDVGLDAILFHDLSFTFDYFYKKTTGLLQQVPVPNYVGVPNNPWANVGSMVNQGIEVQLAYNKQVGKWNFGVIANFSTLQNKVTDIGIGTDYLEQDAANFQTMGTVNRSVVGYPINSFWGYKTNGIFQTTADVQNYTNKGGTVIQPNAQPGDFRWVDNNGDGMIDSKDATYLGSNLPKYNYGLTFTMSWGDKDKGFIDLLLFFQGQGGNMVFQGYRRLDIAGSNYTTDVLNRWTGAGTSNTYPRLTLTDPNGNFNKMSDFYLQKGDYFRLKNLQIGYAFPTKWFKTPGGKQVVERFRLYIAFENLATITGYNGYDPEIGGGVFGIDKGFYPQARSYMFGINVQF